MSKQIITSPLESDFNSFLKKADANAKVTGLIVNGYKPFLDLEGNHVCIESKGEALIHRSKSPETKVNLNPAPYKLKVPQQQEDKVAHLYIELQKSFAPPAEGEPIQAYLYYFVYNNEKLKEGDEDKYRTTLKAIAVFPDPKTGEFPDQAPKYDKGVFATHEEKTAYKDYNKEVEDRATTLANRA